MTQRIIATVRIEDISNYLNAHGLVTIGGGPPDAEHVLPWLLVAPAASASQGDAPPAPKTRVVNLHKEEYDVYIGRPGRGHDGYPSATLRPSFGNSHRIGYCKTCSQRNGRKVTHDRLAAITAFRRDFEARVERDPEFRERVLGLRGKRLGCFCKPKACHGDIIVAWLEQTCGERSRTNAA